MLFEHVENLFLEFYNNKNYSFKFLRHVGIKRPSYFLHGILYTLNKMQIIIVVFNCNFLHNNPGIIMYE